jgi:hypothetical protein
MSQAKQVSSPQTAAVPEDKKVTQNEWQVCEPDEHRRTQMLIQANLAEIYKLEERLAARDHQAEDQRKTSAPVQQQKASKVDRS